MYKNTAALVFLAFFLAVSIVSTYILMEEIGEGEDIILESYTADNNLRLSIENGGMYVSHNQKKWELKLKVDNVDVELASSWNINEKYGNMYTTIKFGNLTFTLTGGIQNDSFEYDYNIIGDTLVRKQETMVRMNTIPKYIDFKKKTEYYIGYIMLSWLPFFFLSAYCIITR